MTPRTCVGRAGLSSWMGRAVLCCAAILVAASCSAESTAAPVFEAAGAQVTPTAVTEEVSGQLSDFFGPNDEIAAPELETVDAESQVPSPTVPPASTDSVSDATPTVAAEGSVAEGSVAERAISLSPASVPAFGAHVFEVMGSGFSILQPVTVILCVVPGEPIDAAIDEGDLASRLNSLDVEQDCHVPTAVVVETDEAGVFTVEISGQVEQNTIVYAAEQRTGSGPFVLVQIST